jgi:hypothetical protein
LACKVEGPQRRIAAAFWFCATQLYSPSPKRAGLFVVRLQQLAAILASSPRMNKKYADDYVLIFVL